MTFHSDKLGAGRGVTDLLCEEAKMEGVRRARREERRREAGEEEKDGKRRKGAERE